MEELDLGDLLDDSPPPLPAMVAIPAGYVAIKQEDYDRLQASWNRTVILAERLIAGERLTKDMLLRALGMFDAATAEALEQRFGGTE